MKYNFLYNKFYKILNLILIKMLIGIIFYKILKCCKANLKLIKTNGSNHYLKLNKNKILNYKLKSKVVLQDYYKKI